MRALVISGGGSKGAFAGGVAEYLITKLKKEYDILVGTSTGSLLISHLALGRIEMLKELYTNVNQSTIFSVNPFVVKGSRGAKTVSINHFKVLWNLIRKQKTFGESTNLRKLLHKTIDEAFFKELKATHKDIVVTVSNLTLGKVEYKSIKDFDRKQFCDWIWASCNYVPFMSLYEKDNCQYADGGFGSLVPIKEAINRGATEIDVIILDTETKLIANIPAKNPFSLISDVLDFTLEQVRNHNVSIGKLASHYGDVQLNLYYTPTILTTNSLIFDKVLMTEWWKDGFAYAKNKHKDTNMSELKFADK
ncbi:patatin-like phospholipase family protein [Wenyingzhuangia aestuarii]|uniref:patatin-like phospholipase family protein n=1 Tax=Wenyingzhuangia aestuarii TaxID=1647582 RepID=UPI001438FF7C|nr:patatin-like phospholipase family protein [Wenyingzhuangia aestuarii]NJB81810.1 putative patatin/cPLA2 family phospholipase [Wenyingzhuangia aestuarii]